MASSSGVARGAGELRFVAGEKGKRAAKQSCAWQLRESRCCRGCYGISDGDETKSVV
jgi:hypothetical protein